MNDLEAANRVCQQVHGHNRSGEVSDAITQAQGTARVVERHGVGESNLDLQAMIAVAEKWSFRSVGVIGM